MSLLLLQWHIIIKAFYYFSDDVDDFIVDDEGNPINKHSKKKRRLPGTVQDS